MIRARSSFCCCLSLFIVSFFFLFSEAILNMLRLKKIVEWNRWMQKKYLLVCKSMFTCPRIAWMETIFICEWNWVKCVCLYIFFPVTDDDKPCFVVVSWCKKVFLQLPHFDNSSKQNLYLICTVHFANNWTSIIFINDKTFFTLNPVLFNTKAVDYCMYIYSAIQTIFEKSKFR